jgi:hypothetical protein
LFVTTKYTGIKNRKNHDIINGDWKKAGSRGYIRSSALAKKVQLKGNTMEQ